MVDTKTPTPSPTPAGTPAPAPAGTPAATPPAVKEILTYHTILTSAGQKKIAEKLAYKEKLVLTKIALGKGKLAEPIPFDTSALVDQVYKEDIDAVGLDADNVFIVVVDFILKADKALDHEVILTELGIYDEDDVLIAVGRIPATTIPAKGSRSAREVVFQVKFEVDSKDSVTLRVFPSAFTKKQWVLDLIVNSLTYSVNKADNVLSAHQGYVLDQKKVNIADIVDNLSTAAANKPLSANKGYDLQAYKADRNADEQFTSVQLTNSSNKGYLLQLKDGSNTVDITLDGSKQVKFDKGIKSDTAHFTSYSTTDASRATSLNTEYGAVIGGSGNVPANVKLNVIGNIRATDIRATGTLTADTGTFGSATVGGSPVKTSDNAYFLEWEDGNPQGEERLGQPVYFSSDNKIAIADKNTPTDSIVGVVSATATVILNTAEFHWNYKYQFDNWGRVKTGKGKYYSFISGDDHITGYENDLPVKPPKKATQANKLVVTDVSDMPLINPKYDPKQAYIPRKDRPEWAVIGLLGTVYVAKGAVVNPSWIKLQSNKDNDLYFIK